VILLSVQEKAADQSSVPLHPPGLSVIVVHTPICFYYVVTVILVNRNDQELNSDMPIEDPQASQSIISCLAERARAILADVGMSGTIYK
jgi:hypothetical protein